VNIRKGLLVELDRLISIWLSFFFGFFFALYSLSFKLNMSEQVEIVFL
jgi:hypothetical protein